MKQSLLIISCVLLASCVNITQNKAYKHRFTGVKIEPVTKKPASVRALEVNRDYIFFAGSKGNFCYLNTPDHSLAYMGQITYQGKHPDFRAVSLNSSCGFILSAGNPALLYRVNYFGKRKLVYKEKGEGVFYNSLAFWNDKVGIALGDPTSNCISILITRDGGETWKKIPCNQLPKAKKGEVAFAASNSNIAIQGSQAWLITGGKHARIYHTPDKGKTWEVQPLPFIEGKKTTGPYSIDFYNENLGYVIGGNYAQPKNNQRNKSRTINGGKTWKSVAQNEHPGYRSCVKFVPNSAGQELVAVGPGGISYSSDGGKSWTLLSEKGFYTLDFMNDYIAYAGGKKGIFKLTFTEDISEGQEVSEEK